MALTATHCLSSTWPACFAEAFGDCSRSCPPLPFVQVFPKSFEYERSMAPSGCSVDLSQKALNGNVTWYARPLVSNATLGSVLFVHDGGIAWVPVETQS